VVTVIDTHRHNSGENPPGAEKEKEKDGKEREREREREKGTAYGML
jgi:hypothetical protein